MKWTNKGHQYDEMFKEIEKKKEYYLFGAGDYGDQIYEVFKDEIVLKGYIDNSPQKVGTIINGLKCFAFNDIERNADIGIVVSMSQIARVNAIEQLDNNGYIRGVDYYIIEEFLSVYYAYKKNQVYLSSISFLPSTICNLNCKKCLNFNPYAKKFYVREWEDLIKDIDLFFACVDKIMLFHVSGGEPMLYKHTAELLRYIDKNYGDRIGTLRTVTNGTVVPKEEVLQVLSECNVEITVDDYRDAVPKFNSQFDQLITKLEEYHIEYYINKADSWIDLAPDRTDYSEHSDDWLIEHRDTCNQSWQELREGKLYSCNYAAYATVAGIAGEQDLEEVYNLANYTEDKKKEFVEFRLGYTTKGYTNFCKRCKGFTPDNNIDEIPAEQVSL